MSSGERPVKPARYDIQGLRALAVTLVIVFHLAPSALPGGYIGVDIFFVISGFLITNHLAREVTSTGTVSVRRFWARRARRLLPAALFVLAISAILALFLAPRTSLLQNLWEIVFASLYLLNWVLAASSVDYLNAHASPTIAQHFWSLSVEEQFYIFWPILIAAAAWLASRRRFRTRSTVLVLMWSVFVGSFALSIFETAGESPSAYFITTTRGWEFAAGGLLTFITKNPRRAGVHNAISWSALLVILACSILFNADTPFPGWIAIIPVAATASLLWVGDSNASNTPQYLLAARPVQFLGDISYAAYLWHWPLIVTFVWVVESSPSVQGGFAIAALTVLLAWLTKVLVEDPIRTTRSRLVRPATTLRWASAGMALVLSLSIVSIFIVKSSDAVTASRLEKIVSQTDCFGAEAIANGCSNPYAITETVNPAFTSTDTFNETGPVSSKVCHKESVENRLEVRCQLTEPGEGKTSVIIVGDSHVDHFAAPLQLVAKSEGWYATTTRRSACSSFSEPYSGAADPGCATWGDETHRAIVEDPSIDVVIVAVRSMLYADTRDYSYIDDRLAALVAAGKKVIVIRTVPGMEMAWPVDGAGVKGPECVEQAFTDDSCAWSPPLRTDWVVGAAESEGAAVVDTWDVMCDKSTCHTIIGGTIAYFDDNHLSTAFALSLAPWLREQLVRLVG